MMLDARCSSCHADNRARGVSATKAYAAWCKMLDARCLTQDAMTCDTRNLMPFPVYYHSQKACWCCSRVQGWNRCFEMLTCSHPSSASMALWTCTVHRNCSCQPPSPSPQTYGAEGQSWWLLRGPYPPLSGKQDHWCHQCSLNMNRKFLPCTVRPVLPDTCWNTHASCHAHESVHGGEVAYVQHCDEQPAGATNSATMNADLQDRLKAREWSCSSLILKRTSSIIGPQLQHPNKVPSCSKQAKQHKICIV